MRVYLPKSDEISIDESLPTVLYHLWNLDSDFEKEINANRVLIIEPEQMKKLPISLKKIEWLVQCAKDNIENIQVFVGNIEEFFHEYKPSKTIAQNYIMVSHWVGFISEMKERPKIFPEIIGFHSSFFGYWKKVTKKTEHVKKWHV